MSPAWQGCLVQSPVSLVSWARVQKPCLVLGKSWEHHLPLSVPVVYVAQGPALQTNPRAVSAWIPSLNWSPDLEPSLAIHPPAEPAQGSVSTISPALPTAIPWLPSSHTPGSHWRWPYHHLQNGNPPLESAFFKVNLVPFRVELNNQDLGTTELLLFLDPEIIFT